MKPRAALIFDVDGTLADTEAVHRVAFNRAFLAEGLGWSWGEALYTELLRVSGGPERLAAYWRSTMPVPPDEGLLARVHATKTRFYTEQVLSGSVPLRPGILPLLEEARARDVALAIATTTTPANVDALLSVALGRAWRSGFAFVGDASTAPRKKPDPQVYEQALAALTALHAPLHPSLNPPLNAPLNAPLHSPLHSPLNPPPVPCLAFEDSENGLRAARAAGIPTVVTPTAFTAGEDFAGALRVLPDLEGVTLDELLALAPSA